MCAFWEDADFTTEEGLSANMRFRDHFNFTKEHQEGKSEEVEVEPMYCDELWKDATDGLGKESVDKLRRVMDLEDIFII